ncbi:hypothetical protein KSP39_PZI019353 [Platanthera zijinensis]|uniref:Uncharacterized protein n=1 Tax=Platanthera zijinensis TaxID=2320716 RepID=A0AAP0B1U5_9ASPA
MQISELNKMLVNRDWECFGPKISVLYKTNYWRNKPVSQPSNKYLRHVGFGSSTHQRATEPDSESACMDMHKGARNLENDNLLE